jgi:hypothetical protein
MTFFLLYRTDGAISQRDKYMTRFNSSLTCYDLMIAYTVTLLAKLEKFSFFFEIIFFIKNSFFIIVLIHNSNQSLDYNYMYSFEVYYSFLFHII